MKKEKLVVTVNLRLGFSKEELDEIKKKHPLRKDLKQSIKEEIFHAVCHSMTDPLSISSEVVIDDSFYYKD